MKEEINKNVCFLCPYFGKLPKEQIEMFIKSCKYNKEFEWYIITDDYTKFNNCSPNVKYIYMSFEQFKEKLKSKFDFDISMKKPYKLCDYKPAYGYIFEDLISNYKYWRIL